MEDVVKVISSVRILQLLMLFVSNVERLQNRIGIYKYLQIT